MEESTDSPWPRYGQWLFYRFAIDLYTPSDIARSIFLTMRITHETRFPLPVPTEAVLRATNPIDEFECTRRSFVSHTQQQQQQAESMIPPQWKPMWTLLHLLEQNRFYPVLTKRELVSVYDGIADRMEWPTHRVRYQPIPGGGESLSREFETSLSVLNAAQKLATTNGAALHDNIPIFVSVSEHKNHFTRSAFPHTRHEPTRAMRQWPVFLRGIRDEYLFREVLDPSLTETLIEMFDEENEACQLDLPCPLPALRRRFASAREGEQPGECYAVAAAAAALINDEAEEEDDDEQESTPLAPYIK